VEILTIDMGLIDASDVGVFIANTQKADEAKEAIRGLAHAALQNQTIELSDILTVLRQDNFVEAEESLKVSEEERKNREAQIQEQQNKAMMELEERKSEMAKENHEREKELVILKEQERRKTVIA